MRRTHSITIFACTKENSMLVIYGSVLASFNVEAFSLERLRTLTMDEIAGRYETFKAMSTFEELP